MFKCEIISLYPPIESVTMKTLLIELSVFIFSLNSENSCSSIRTAKSFSGSINIDGKFLVDSSGHLPIHPVFIHKTGKSSLNCRPNATAFLSRKPSLKKAALDLKPSDISRVVSRYVPFNGFLFISIPLIEHTVRGQVT